MLRVPTIENVFENSRRKVRYRVLAYRKMSETEIRVSVRAYLDLEKIEPKENSELTIVTSIGFVWAGTQPACQSPML